MAHEGKICHTVAPSRLAERGGKASFKPDCWQLSGESHHGAHFVLRTEKSARGGTLDEGYLELGGKRALVTAVRKAWRGGVVALREARSAGCLDGAQASRTGQRTIHCRRRRLPEKGCAAAPTQSESLSGPRIRCMSRPDRPRQPALLVLETANAQGLDQNCSGGTTGSGLLPVMIDQSPGHHSYHLDQGRIRCRGDAAYAREAALSNYSKGLSKELVRRASASSSLAGG